jgi:hypothetical protein
MVYDLIPDALNPEPGLRHRVLGYRALGFGFRD